jgi:hypothetical protein
MYVYILFTFLSNSLMLYFLYKITLKLDSIISKLIAMEADILIINNKILVDFESNSSYSSDNSIYETSSENTEDNNCVFFDSVLKNRRRYSF